jgi:hypothetical protein
MIQISVLFVTLAAFLPVEHVKKKKKRKKDRNACGKKVTILSNIEEGFTSLLKEIGK